MSWWLWIALGLVLAAIELATPGGFFVIFFGVAALVVGLLAMADLVLAVWLQWLIFPLLALVALRFFRRPLLKLMGSAGPGVDVDSLIGELAIPAVLMAPGDHGRAEARGSTWNARNAADTALLAGQRCRVIAVHGLVLDLRPE